MGSQHMYNLSLTFLAGAYNAPQCRRTSVVPHAAASDGSANASDSSTTPFGIRQVNSFINSDGFRQYQVNGQNILIRGAGCVTHSPSPTYGT